MKFILIGNLSSQACTDCNSPVQRGRIRLYSTEANRETFSEIAADTKDTLALLSEKQQDALGGLLVGEGLLDEQGNFKIALSERYQDGPVRIVAELDAPDGKDSKKGTASIYLTTLLPNWEYGKDQAQAISKWAYVIPSAFWCRLLEFFDLWVICGKVGVCKHPGKYAAGVKVSAFDADLIKDDALGSALTDSNGHFRIYYRTIDFKKTFLSPFINLETPFSRVLGPDVYFIIEDNAGNELLKEGRPEGKQDGRKDVGRCLCVDLCVDIGDIPTKEGEPIWMSVGSRLTISTFGNPNVFDNDGYADVGAGKYAIHSTTTLDGQVPDPTKGAATPLYRFLVGNSVDGNNAPASPAAGFTRIVGVDPGLYVDGAHLGRLWRFSPSLDFVDVKLSSSDFVDVTMPDASISKGWVDVQRAAQRALDNDSTLSPADRVLSAWIWVSSPGQMIGLNTLALTNHAAHVAPSGLKAGGAVASGLFPIEKVAIRFESIDRVTKAARPGNGTTLNAMVVNNSAPIARLALLRGVNDVGECSQFSNEDVGVAYTFYHPHLGSSTLSANSADGSYHSWPAPSTSPTPTVPPMSPVVSLPLTSGLTLANNSPRPGIDSVNGSGILLSPRPDHTCTYDVYLGYVLLRHNGEHVEDGTSIRKSFFYQA